MQHLVDKDKSQPVKIAATIVVAAAVDITHSKNPFKVKAHISIFKIWL